MQPGGEWPSREAGGKATSEKVGREQHVESKTTFLFRPGAGGVGVCFQKFVLLYEKRGHPPLTKT